MAYIGVQLPAGQYRKLDDISSGFNGSTTIFNMTVDGDAVTAVVPQQLLVSVGGVIQQPNVDYTTSTNSITFTTAPASGLSFFAILMGDAVNIGTPSDGSVTTAKLDSTGIAPIVTSLNGGPLAGTRNRIINGDMRIDQRNAGAAVTINSTANTYCIDRWFANAQNADGVFTVDQITDAPAGFTNSTRITVTTADSSVGSTQLYLFRQAIEGNNVYDFGLGTANAKTFTFSFWVRSSLTGTFGGALNNSANDRNYPFTYSISAANTWEYKTVTVAGDTTGTWLTDAGRGLTLTFQIGAGSSSVAAAGSWTGTSGIYGATGATNIIGTLNATWGITGVQLEAGTVATPFERRSYGHELALCQRYFEWVSASLIGYQSTTGEVVGSTVNFSVTKRTTATLGSLVGDPDSSSGTNSLNVANSGLAYPSSNGCYLFLVGSTSAPAQLYARGYRFSASAEL